VSEVPLYESFNYGAPKGTHLGAPLSREYGTYKTVNARFWPWLAGEVLLPLEFFPLRWEAVGLFRFYLS
jgi:hypothetical protein